MKFTIDELTRMMHAAVLDGPIPTPLHSYQGIREVLRLAILGSYCELHHTSSEGTTREVATQDELRLRMDD
jgi:hypothetical protein